MILQNLPRKLERSVLQLEVFIRVYMLFVFLAKPSALIVLDVVFTMCSTAQITPFALHVVEQIVLHDLIFFFNLKHAHDDFLRRPERQRPCVRSSLCGLSISGRRQPQREGETCVTWHYRE